MYELFMQAPAAIAVLRGPEHVFEFANPLFLQMVGRKSGLHNKSVRDALPEGNGQGFFELMDKTYATGVAFVGNELPAEIDLDDSGQLTRNYINLVYQPLKDSNGYVSGIMIHAVNVTAAVEAKAQSRANEERYQTLFNSINQGFCIIKVLFDENNVADNYEFIEVNKMFEEQTGIKDSVGQTIKQIAPDIELTWIRQYGDVVTSGKPLHTLENSLALGRWFEVSASRTGNPEDKLVAVLFTDITERKKTEQALRRSELRHRTVVETLEEGVIVHDSRGAIISANKSAQKLLGLTMDQLQGLDSMDPHWKAVYEDGRIMPGSEHPPQRVLHTKKALKNYTMGIYKPDGAMSWLTVNAQPIMEKGQLTGIIVSFFEITERKKIQEALEQQLQTTKTVTNIASSCLFMINTTGLVTYMNPAAERVTGYKLRQCMGTSVHELLHHSRPDGSPYPEVDCGLVATYTKGRPNPMHEDVFWRKDGSSFPALVSATPIAGKAGVTATVVEFRDITDEKKAIQTLATSEARLRFMSESMPQKVSTATADGRIDYINKEWTDYTGLTLQDIQDGGWERFLHPDDVKPTLKAWTKAIKTGEAFEMEHRFKRFDGVYHSHLSRSRPMHDDNGKITRWFGSNTDIEEIKATLKRKNELEESTALLKEQRAQLVALNDAKDDFIALASHQLRTPATAVKQYLGLVLDGFSDPLTESQSTFIRTAYESNERQLNIITDLLRTAKLDSSRYTLRKQYDSVSDILQLAIADMQPVLAIKEQKVAYKAVDEALSSLLDSNEMKLVFMNLLENASKYSYPNTIIHVSVKKTKGMIQIDFVDAGVGISPKDTVRIFDKFTRINNDLSDTVTGTGLGLYWVNKIVKLHNGRIDVKSELGKGSKFTVSLPL